MRVAFQGELGAFSELAIAQWNRGAEPVPCREFTDVTRAVLAGDVDAGVLPMDNTTIGPITAARAALAETPLAIIGETRVAIHPLLLARPGVRLDDIRQVSSHPAALGQCAAFLARHPHWNIIPSYDTAGAARDLARAGDATRAVLASAASAQRYALEILQSDITDRADNTTRFVVIAAVATASQPAP